MQIPHLLPPKYELYILEKGYFFITHLGISNFIQSNVFAPGTNFSDVNSVIRKFIEAF